MLSSQNAIGDAAAKVRAVAANLAAVQDELAQAAVWHGNDAKRFTEQWQESVQSPLNTAAAVLDGVDFVRFQPLDLL